MFGDGGAVMNTPIQTGDGTQPSLLTLKIPDKEALYQSYMPFIKNGGLFIPTTREYRIGDAVIILLIMLNDPERLTVSGRVVWVTPRDAQNKRKQGIGVQFSLEDGGVVQKKIESHLVSMLNPNNATPTYTL